MLCVSTVIACFGAPAGATFSGSGELSILVRPEGSVDLVERAPAAILPTDIDIQDGSADITDSTLDADLSVRRGTATITDSVIHGFRAEPSEQAFVVVQQSSVDRATPLVTQGRHTLDHCTFTSGGFDFVRGFAEWTDSTWAMSGPMRIGGEGVSTALTIDASIVDATSLEIAAGSMSVLQLRVGTDLDVSGGVDVHAPLGGSALLHVQSGSSVVVDGELGAIGPAAVLEAEGGVIDVGTRLALGAQDGTCGQGGSSDGGTLRVAAGGIAVVRGELLLCAGATIDLQPGGTVRAASLNDLGGSILENGGTLIVPEANAAFAGGLALAAIAILRASPRRSRHTPRRFRHTNE